MVAGMADDHLNIAVASDGTIYARRLKNQL